MQKSFGGLSILYFIGCCWLCIEIKYWRIPTFKNSILLLIKFFLDEQNLANLNPFATPGQLKNKISESCDRTISTSDQSETHQVRNIIWPTASGRHPEKCVISPGWPKPLCRRVEGRRDQTKERLHGILKIHPFQQKWKGIQNFPNTPISNLAPIQNFSLVCCCLSFSWKHRCQSPSLRQAW